ncbi:restriction endonuclease subunit S [Streptomyces sp. NBC_01264]|uniref:restriction endonuclease subunit S n=1 Tax=Streptomyces sp. NBC_01264 TaxID=2903804 RepID=UPI0022538D9E|nr:restriction endonuclease subunit S [Streptomyces sp. NBC_01264]MCX4776745.1 restriction endonuclease subunit S [Streptomyces sp. NBC_01264]
MSWATIPLKRIAVLTAGGTPAVGEPTYWSDEGEGNAWVSISDMSSVDSVTATARRVSDAGLRSARIALGDPGTLLFSMYASLGHTAWLSTPAAWNQAILGMRSDSTTDARFLRYSLVSLRPTLLEQARSNTQSNLNAEQVGNLAIPRPPLGEQRRVADFLDVETARIDRTAAARQAQQSILRERELSLISETLSGGVGPRGGRSTGMPWLPAIPADWKIGPVYAYFSTELGKMLNAERATGDRQRPYLRNANVHWYDIDISDMATMSFDASETHRYSVAPGDLLVCEGGAGVAEAAVWNGEISDCYYQKSLHRVRRSGHVPVEWLMYWLRLAKHVGVFEADGNIATIPHLTGEQLREYRIPIPPDGDSRVVALNHEVRDLLSLVKRLDQAQALLAERRQALITAAVTGQLDVTTARPARDL